MSTIRIEEDRSRPGGYALIRLGAQIGDGDPRFTLERETPEKPRLGPDGWQAEPVLLSPDEVREEGGETVLVIGPDVVDEVEEDTLITVAVPALGLTWRDYWPSLTVSGRPRRKSAVVGTTGSHVGAKTVRAPEPPVPPAPMPPPLPKPPADASPAPEPVPPTTPVPAAPVSRSGVWIAAGIAALFLLIAAGAGAYWWLVMRHTEPQVAQTEPAPQPSAPAPAAEAPSSAEPQQSAPPAATPPAPAAPAPVDPRETLRQLAQSGTPAELHDFGQRQIAEGQRDIGFTAIDISQQRGNPQARLQFGRWYDPRYQTESRFFSKPDPTIAARYYQDARNAGAAEAGDELRGLCTALENDPPADPAAEDAARMTVEQFCR